MRIIHSAFLWLFRQRIPASRMIIHNPTGEAAWSLGYALFYILAAAATGILIRARPWPLLGAADFTQDFSYIFVFKIGLLLVVPLAVFLRAGRGFERPDKWHRRNVDDEPAVRQRRNTTT